MKKILTRAIYLALAGYLLLCVTLYFMQGALIFPSRLAPPVTDRWQPTVGVLHQQALLDGRCGKLHAVIWQVAGARGTVMVFHGNGESIASVETEVPRFQQLGYSVMAWDYPGYGRSTACWFSEDDLLHDADTAFNWLGAQHAAAPVVFFGSSIGTGLALYVASKHPHHEVLLVSPYDALVNVAQDHLPFFVPVSMLIRYPLHADEWITQTQGPIHAIHGLADTLIAPERAMALIRKAKGRADIEWVDGAGHNDLGLFERDRRWLARSLLNP